VIAGSGVSVVVPFRDVPPDLINLLFGGVMLGETGYRAYGNSVEWKNYLGQPMPEWGNLPEPIRIAWDRAACAIVDAAYVAPKSDSGTICVCGHSSHLHDVDEADGSGARCCVGGCDCGTGR
jgi:hypothetical protein